MNDYEDEHSPSEDEAQALPDSPAEPDERQDDAVPPDDDAHLGAVPFDQDPDERYTAPDPFDPEAYERWITAQAKIAPVAEEERFITLDVIRGIALLGILLVNIGSFALIVEGRRQPWIVGGSDPLNMFMWRITYLLADTKFIMIFTMLFGAGIYVMTTRRRRRGQYGITAYYRRMIFLATLGTLHGYFLWEGDILFLYGFYGLFLFPLSFFPPSLLFIAGAVAIYFDAANYGWAPAFYTYPSPEFQIEHLRGGWLEQLPWRKLEFGNMQTFGPKYFALQGAGAMVLGMGLLGLGFLNGKWPRALYPLIALAGLVGGVLAIGIPTEFGPNYDTKMQQQFVYWGSLTVTFGWIGFAASLATYLPRFGLTKALAATGRMALTNYLAQSLICTTIFYGHGLGLFQRLDRVEMNLVVLTVWIVELTWSPIWLSHFRFGPVEWLWRSVTYWQLQPFRIGNEVDADVAPRAEAESTPQDWANENLGELLGVGDEELPETDHTESGPYVALDADSDPEEETPILLEPYDPDVDIPEDLDDDSDPEAEHRLAD